MRTFQSRMKNLKLFLVFALVFIVESSWATGPRVVRVGVGGGGIGAMAFTKVIDHFNKSQKEILVKVTVIEKSDRVAGQMITDLIPVQYRNGTVRDVPNAHQIIFSRVQDYFDEPEFRRLNLGRFLQPLAAQQTLLAAYGNSGQLDTFLLPRPTDPDDLFGLMRTGMEFGFNGLLSLAEMKEAAVASQMLYNILLRGENLGDIFTLRRNMNARARSYNQKMGYRPGSPFFLPEDFDAVSARDFLSRVRFPLNFNFFDPGSLLSFSLLPHGYSSVGFSQKWINKVVEPGEKLVEWTTSHTMSALNYGWQALHMTKAGKLMTAARGTHLIPEAINDSFGPDITVEFEKEIIKVNDTPSGAVSVIVQLPNGQLKKREFDFFYSTLESQDVLQVFAGTRALTPELKAAMEANHYTATIAVTFLTDQDSEAIFGKLIPSLAVEEGLFRYASGLTFLSGFSDWDLDGQDLVTGWLSSDFSLRLLEQKKLKGWSDDQLEQEARNAILEDVNSLVARHPRRPDLRQLARTLSRAQVAKFKVFPRAVPEFGRGYVDKVEKYVSTIDSPVFIGGQITAERSWGDVMQRATLVGRAYVQTLRRPGNRGRNCENVLRR